MAGKADKNQLDDVKKPETLSQDQRDVAISIMRDANGLTQEEAAQKVAELEEHFAQMSPEQRAMMEAQARQQMAAMRDPINILTNGIMNDIDTLQAAFNVQTQKAITPDTDALIARVPDFKLLATIDTKKLGDIIDTKSRALEAIVAARGELLKEKESAAANPRAQAPAQQAGAAAKASPPGYL